MAGTGSKSTLDMLASKPEQIAKPHRSISAFRIDSFADGKIDLVNFLVAAGFFMLCFIGLGRHAGYPHRARSRRGDGPEHAAEQVQQTFDNASEPS